MVTPKGWRWARTLSQRMLAPLGDRWAHVRAVGERAESVARALPPDDRGVLIAAAYLHDIGYAPALHDSGAHQLDGARYLRGLGHDRLSALVAHHSQARFEVRLRGLADELAQFDDERSTVSDALTYCDMAIGPAGQQVNLDERLDEIATRYKPGELVVTADVHHEVGRGRRSPARPPRQKDSLGTDESAKMKESNLIRPS